MPFQFPLLFQTSDVKFSMLNNNLILYDIYLKIYLYLPTQGNYFLLILLEKFEDTTYIFKIHLDR